LETEWQTPLSLVMETNISAITDPPSNESSNPKHELLERCDCASNGRVGDFGLVQWNDHDQEADTYTCEPSTRPEHVNICSSCLQGSTEKVDNTSDDNGQSSSKFVSRLPGVSNAVIVDFGASTYRTCQSSSTESTSSKERDDNATKLLTVGHCHGKE
jgi:hypothetical protein